MIVTFYSYKGGVGRSMALVNVAEILADAGYRVVACDFDLEAPGLERYFADDAKALRHYRSQTGVVDLLEEYKTVMAAAGEAISGTTSDRPDERRYTSRNGIWIPRPSGYLVDVPTQNRGRRGSVSLLTAGRRDGKWNQLYSERVQQFDWEDFYASWAGDIYFDFFRHDLMDDKAIVLVDSRTGVTEHGGVCTHHLADLVVLLSAANDLNIEGTKWMAEVLASDATFRMRRGRPLKVLPVAARIEVFSEVEELEAFRRRFQDAFIDYVPVEAGDPAAFIRESEIPYVPFYAFTERIVARQDAVRQRELYDAYQALARAVVAVGCEAQLIRRPVDRAWPDIVLARPEAEEGVGAQLQSHREWLGSGGKRGKRAVFRGFDLTARQLPSARLRQADLTEAHLEHANLHGADLRSATLVRALLGSADLTEASLEGSDLTGADLAGATLGRATLVGAKLRNADLRRADLTLADLRDADLTLAKLDGADLRGAYLDGAIGLTVEHLQLALTDPATSGTLPQDELRVEGEVEAAGALSPRPRARGWRSVLWPLVVGLLAATGIYAVVTAGFSSALSRMQLRSLVVTSLIVAILAYVGAAVALTRLRNRRSRDRPAIERMPHGQGQRDRNAMLKRVRTAWIEGVLEQSLASTIWIELGLDRRPYAVRTPANTLISPFNGQGSVLPSGMPISEIFDELGQALMILGPPGSGKTTLLLTLARDLLDRAERDSSHPIPVVFNLSSWAAGSHSLADWLVEELAGTYDVPRRLGQAWIEREQVMPLLDGLDEVAAEHRKACVEAINAFREQHGLVPMVVCSRTAEFAALAVKLRLLGAVEIQPLTRSQVNAYLTQAGKSLAGVRAALRQDPTLWEFLSSPLELSVMALAYRGRSSAAVRAHGTPEQRRHELLDAYVTMMLARRGQGAEFPSDKTVRWLAWLAWSLQRRNQTEFRLEHIRPDWLPTRAQQRLLAVGSALLVGLLAGLSLGAAVGLLSGLLAGLLSGLLSGALFGLLAGLLGDRPDSRSTVSKQGIRGSVRNAAFVGIVVGLLSGLLIGLLTAPFRGLAAGLLLGLPAGLLLGGASTLQHVLLRILLTRSNYAPWRYARFLDYAADHLLLRKVGGGYIFAHRLLQEHFAMMDAGQAASASR